MIKKIPITDLTDQQISIYNSRSETVLFRMNEPAPGIFIAETELVIRRALDAGFVPLSMLCLEDQLENLSDLIKKCENLFFSCCSNNKYTAENENVRINEHNSILSDINCGFPVYYAKNETLKNLIGFPLTRGVLCAMKRKILPDTDTVLADAKNIAVLCEIENPTNIGTIFRNAAALNIDAVILYGNCSDPLYRRSLRAGMGCQFSIPWTFSDNLLSIKEKGFSLAALALSDESVTLSEFSESDIAKKAILLGNEGKGLSEEILKICDHVIKIPMREGIDSLNVAVASGIAFYEICLKNR